MDLFLRPMTVLKIQLEQGLKLKNLLTPLSPFGVLKAVQLEQGLKLKIFYIS